jgi:hypothetical protein
MQQKQILRIKREGIKMNIIRNRGHVKGILLLLLIFIFTSCSQKSVYDANVIIEAKFTSVVQKYALWKAAAPPDVQQRWRETIDPMIVRGDQLLDTYNTLLKTGEDTTNIVVQIDIIITQILIEIAKQKGANSNE